MRARARACVCLSVLPTDCCSAGVVVAASIIYFSPEDFLMAKC